MIHFIRSCGAIEVIFTKFSFFFSKYIPILFLDCSEVEIRLLDMQSLDNKIIILAAAINASNTPQIYYALITLTESGSTFVINSYCQLKHSSFYTGNVSADNLKMKFIINRNTAYVYDEKVIYQVYMNGKKPNIIC